VSPDHAQHDPVMLLDYCQRVFILLHQDLERMGYIVDTPHAKRARFWRLVHFGEYEPLAARELVSQYLRGVEQELATIVGKQSLAYWLHLYRRLSPSPIGTNKEPATIGLVRAALESAIQEYAGFRPCNRVGIVGQVPIAEVLGGLLLHRDFELERDALSAQRQLVLTDFGAEQLVEFYEVEKLAYEVWRSSALLRIIGKGASIAVHTSESCVDDLRSSELATLVESFDKRSREYSYGSVSSTGVVYGEEVSGRQNQGWVFLPVYNVTSLSTDDLHTPFSEVFHVEFAWPVRLNFVWLPFNLSDYRDAHLPFASAFAQDRMVDLDAVLLVIAALCRRAQHLWMHNRVLLLRYWQRAYEGPYVLGDFIKDEIAPLIPEAAHVLGIEEERAVHLDISSAIQFLTLNDANRSNIDVSYSGPHYVFLPFGTDRMFIDYAWIFRQLYNLFVGVRIPDQNFKGDALERLVRTRKSVLPVGACRSRTGGERQIDAAFSAGSRLVIVECRAVWKSIGFERGQPEAIRYRTSMIDRSLDDVDEKARWLASNACGSNYDVRSYDDILPVVVTPFVEFIPSLSPRYWLREGVPRVLTPRELEDALDTDMFGKVSYNTVPVQQKTDSKSELRSSL
jgi:hypothetical protein